MERRTLLAFILSFVVLSAWSALLPKPAHKTMSNVETPRTQITANAEITAITPPLKNFPQTSEVNVQEELTPLETTKILAHFSNKGGSFVDGVLKEYNATLPVTNIFSAAIFSDEIFRLEAKTENTVVYLYEGEGMSVRKKYTIEKDGYFIRAEIQIANQKIDTPIEAFKLDINRLDKSRIDNRDNSLFEYFIITQDQTIRREHAAKFSSKDAKHQPVEDVQLVGFRDRYFSLLVDPDFDSKEFIIDPVDTHVVNIRLVPKTTGVYAANIYFGPQKLDVLKKYNFGLEKAMVFSSWGWLDAFAKAIYMVMHWMHKVIPNWGACILLISFSIYGVMYPLTRSGMASMKRMQALQPTMNKLREQYKNNPQRLNQEIMELYKQNKVNPLGGCLPLFLQMPVFVALYQVLWRTVDFKGADFLWIKDLAEPDRLVILPVSLPIIGNEINILPILMMVIMFFQQKLSAKNMVITDPAQEAQQKMMTMFFPIFLGFIFYKFASGLSLYFTTFYSMSTLAQWRMSKKT